MAKAAREVPPLLELLCLKALWQLQEGNVAAVRRVVSQTRPLAYTTIMTVLDRLVAKQVLARTMDNNQYTYTALLNRADYTRSAVREIIDGLVAGFGAPVYAQFFDQIQSADPEQLELLAKMIGEAEAKKKDRDK